MTHQFAAAARALSIALLVSGSVLTLAAAEQAASGSDAVERIEIRIENRQVLRDRVIRINHDQTVQLLWMTDEATELHIHGYDIRFEIAPDVPAEVLFTAHATGRFAVTSHGFGDEHGHGHETLVYIEVYPN
jgi:hypothetical protein